MHSFTRCYNNYKLLLRLPRSLREWNAVLIGQRESMATLRSVKAGIVWTDCGEAPSESVALAFGFATPLIVNDAECDHHRNIDIGRNLDDVGIPAHKQIWKVAKVPS